MKKTLSWIALVFGVMAIVGSFTNGPLNLKGLAGGIILTLIGTFSLDKIKKSK
jgi:hypothetical protein